MCPVHLYGALPNAKNSIYAWGYIPWPKVNGEKLKLTLEARLYEVNAESLMWAGELRLTDPGVVGQVIAAVINELEKNGLLPSAP